jgi:hypothetical protein
VQIHSAQGVPGHADGKTVTIREDLSQSRELQEIQISTGKEYCIIPGKS